MKVLVIDDVDYIRKSIERVLGASGFHCDVAENGFRGKEMVESNHYDLIITDIMMPDMDGYEFLDYLRSAPAPKGETPVLAISGGDKTINSDVALDTIRKKADAVLQKPFAKADLMAAILKVLGPEKYNLAVKSA